LLAVLEITRDLADLRTGVLDVTVGKFPISFVPFVFMETV
jgi:hypothetical protein